MTGVVAINPNREKLPSRANSSRRTLRADVMKSRQRKVNTRDYLIMEKKLEGRENKYAQAAIAAPQPA